MDFVSSAQALDLQTYLQEIGDPEKVLHMLVGDTQRIEVYADQGFAIPQDMPGEVSRAFDRLRKAGFTVRLL